MSLIVKKDFGVIDSGSCIVGFTLGFAVCLGTFVDNFTPNVPESKVHLQNLRIQQKKAKILQNNVVEICVSDMESVIEAIKGGANSLELCSNRIEGGVTPSLGLIEETVRRTRGSNVGVHVLIRPRPGGFVYSAAEFELILRDIVSAKHAQADGVVVGLLTEDGEIDLARMRVVREVADGLVLTFHRAFDQALEQLADLKVDRLLTSGRGQNALEGAEVLRQLQTHSMRLAGYHTPESESISASASSFESVSKSKEEQDGADRDRDRDREEDNLHQEKPGQKQVYYDSESDSDTDTDSEEKDSGFSGGGAAKFLSRLFPFLFHSDDKKERERRQSTRDQKVLVKVAAQALENVNHRRAQVGAVQIVAAAGVSDSTVPALLAASSLRAVHAGSAVCSPRSAFGFGVDLTHLNNQNRNSSKEKSKDKAGQDQAPAPRARMGVSFTQTHANTPTKPSSSQSEDADPSTSSASSSAAASAAVVSDSDTDSFSCAHSPLVQSLVQTCEEQWNSQLNAELRKEEACLLSDLAMQKALKEALIDAEEEREERDRCPTTTATAKAKATTAASATSASASAADDKAKGEASVCPIATATPTATATTVVATKVDESVKIKKACPSASVLVARSLGLGVDDDEGEDEDVDLETTSSTPPAATVTATTASAVEEYVVVD